MEKIWSRFTNKVSRIIDFAAYELQRDHPSLWELKKGKWKFCIQDDCDARFLSTSNDFSVFLGHVFWLLESVDPIFELDTLYKSMRTSPVLTII